MFPFWRETFFCNYFLWENARNVVCSVFFVAVLIKGKILLLFGDMWLNVPKRGAFYLVN